MKKPIELDFPIEEVNEIAEREAHAKEKYRPIMYIHKWWARRLGSVFRTIVLYTLADENTSVLDEKTSNWRKVTRDELDNPWLLYLKDVDFGGKIVLDPMMGGGTTVVESLRTGCKVVAQDLNPVAWFLVKNIVEPVDIQKLKKAFGMLEGQVADEIKKYYRTICPHCIEKYARMNGRKPEEVIRAVSEDLRNGINVYEKYTFNDGFFDKKSGIFADTMYYFWVKELPCMNCGKKIPLFRGYMHASARYKKGYVVICPECRNLFEVKDYTKDAMCPRCGKKFNPDKDGNVDRANYVCTDPDCGQRYKIVDAIKRTKKPDERLYAVEYYCPICGNKNYKQADDFDLALIQKAKEEFKGVESKWLGKYIPDTEIPKGVKTKEPLNHGYRCWKDMFNERQLLSLGKLLKAILELNVDENIRELLAITFSDALNFNNMLCEYNRAANMVKELFSRHAFYPSLNPVENVVWGTDYGRGTFKNYMDKCKLGKEYNTFPFEKYIKNGKTLEKPMRTKIIGKPGNVFDGANVMITCGDSSYLNIPDRSVDAVITDPPYYGNVMYSELSEFYYSWLRLALKNKYEYFTSEHVPNATEVIVNNVQGKGEKEFVDGLTSVFKEAGRKLKDDGLMVFTFHHQEEKAWGAVLQSVLNAGFYIPAIYPVQSEKGASTHIFKKANVTYDMVVVCRKRELDSEREHWSKIEDEIYFKVEDELKRLEKNKKNLSQEDVFVVAIGKCLELYSKHYPKVYKNDHTVSIDEALESIREIVDSQLMHTRFNQISFETDSITAIYLTYLARGTSISYDTLNKILKMRSIPAEEVMDSGLVEKRENQLLVLTPTERKSLIEKKRKENLSAIDRAHYLYCMWKEGKIFEFERGVPDTEKDEWSSDKIMKTLEYLCELDDEKSKDYSDVMDFLKKKWGTQHHLEV